MAPRVRKRCYRIDVTGIVQGVGFRPFIYRLAQELDLPGYVFNHDRGVTIEVEGGDEAMDCFLQDISLKAPEAARVDSVTHTEVDWKGYEGFEIRESPAPSKGKFVPVSPDLALCEDCRGEIWDVTDRRYFYPFTNCTNCGPRYTIIKDVPYDRKKTTMDDFKMCETCQLEYDTPTDRRFHAQPNACPACGPQLAILDAEGKAVDVPVFFNRNKAYIERCALLLKQGSILAIKGVGGFHIACDARSESVVQILRKRKNREAKALAVMFPDVDAIHKEVELNVDELKLLQSRAAPIVLLKKKVGKTSIAPSVAPGNRDLGVLMPYTPLHELLVKTCGFPLVMTSGNLSDEPIACSQEDALDRLRGIVDFFVVHNREIYARNDDSVIRWSEEGTCFYRRSRGYSPAGVIVTEAFSGNVLALGGELKNTFCLGKKDEARLEALLSPHIGDLENALTLNSFEQAVKHFEKLFNFRPDLVVHDLHPDYLNTKWAEKRFKKRIGVQHHHAHIAACLEDNACHDAVIGLALDGTGYGTDGKIWGGEVLIADRRDFIRVGKMRDVDLPGGAASIQNPWRIGFAYALQSGVALHDLKKLPPWQKTDDREAVSPQHMDLLAQMIAKRLNCYATSSCGRLFDAVSGLLSVVREAKYEGQAAIELERCLSGGGDDPISSIAPYSFGWNISEKKGAMIEMDWRPVVRAVVEDINSGVGPREVSLKFHRGLVDALSQAVLRVSERTGLKTVALSGGCFLNLFLRERLRDSLEKRGFNVLSHKQVPTNDGGISFGQAVIANQILLKKDSLVEKFR